MPDLFGQQNTLESRGSKICRSRPRDVVAVSLAGPARLGGVLLGLALTQSNHEALVSNG